MKPTDVKDNTYIVFDKELNDESPKFKISDHLRVSKNKNIFAKGYTPNWSGEVFVIKKVKNTVPSTVKKLLEHFMKKNCKKQIKNNSELKKYSRKKLMKYMFNGKDMIIAGLINKTW